MVLLFLVISLPVAVFAYEPQPPANGVRPSFEEEYDRKVSELIKTLSSQTTTPEASLDKYNAIRLLGRLRAEEACDILVKSIKSPAFRRSKWGLLQRYPAAQSLVEIGTPAYNAIWGRLDGRVDDLELRIFACIIYKLDGKELGIARVRQLLSVKEAEYKAARLRGLEILDPPILGNLKSIADLLSTQDFTDPANFP